MSRLRSIYNYISVIFKSHSFNTGWLRFIITGYKQSFTGCSSQRKQCSCYSTKTYVNIVILILTWIWLRWETFTLNVIFVENHNLWRFDCTQWLWFTDSVCSAAVIVLVYIKDMALFQSRLNILFKFYLLFIDWS